MAPQPPRPSNDADNLTQQNIRAENEAAREGGENDPMIERGSTERLDQNPAADEADRGLERREKIQRSPQDDARAAIAKRFRRDEPENERPFNNDFADNENLYGEYGRQDEPKKADDQLSDEEYDEIAADREALGLDPDVRKPKPAPQDKGEPRMITRKVRGKDVTKSEDEWLADAAKVTAADSYLEEAKALLAEAREIRRARTAPDRQHPDGEEDAQELEPEPRQTEDHHPDPTFRQVVERLQYGDPDEAAELLERVVESRANKATDEGALKRAFDQDLARSQKQLKAFSDANPDLASDRIAAMAIEQGMYDLYREDILALGIEADKIPKTPRELANWHRFYRVHGYEVRGTTDLLNKSKEQFLKWRGGQKPSPTQQNREQPSRPSPRVRVNVDRDERRMAIPNQPNRGVSPQRDAPPPLAKGSDVVLQMRRARGQA